MDITEPADSRELIEEAVERGEAHERDAEAKGRAFRDRVAILVGLFAVALAIVHMKGEGAARTSLARQVQAADSFSYLEAKRVREAIYLTAADGATGQPRAAAYRAEAARLRANNARGTGIGQLEAKGRTLAEEGARAAEEVEGFELGETALQLAIVLLSISLVARLSAIVAGAAVIAAIGIACALAAWAGVALPFAG